MTLFFPAMDPAHIRVQPIPKLGRNAISTNTLFIDDLAGNVAAARAVGMCAVRFESPPALRAQLESKGLLAARGPAGPDQTGE